MNSDEINNVESAESERLLSGNIVQAHIYGSKDPDAQASTMADSVGKPPNQSNTRPQYIAALAATGGALAAGTTLGWSSMLEERMKGKIAEDYDFFISNDEFDTLSSLVTLGAALVCLVIGLIIDKFGRKTTMLMLVIPFTIGWALVTFAPNVLTIMIGRFILGLSGGAFCVAAPTYTAEIAEARVRGSLGSYFQLMLVIGVVFAYIVGMIARVFVFNVICAMIPLIFGAIFMFMPESPSYLIAKDRKDDAAKSLKWLRGNAYDYSDELAELQAQREADKKNKVSFRVAFSRQSTKRALFISLSLMFFQQMSGINAIIFFTAQIFKEANTGINPGVATIVVGIMQVIAVFISSLIVDKAGRRLLLLPSVIVMTICHVIVGGYSFMQEHNKSAVASLGFIPVIAVCVFIILFSLGMGPIPWMMMGELFSNDVKGVASSAAGAFNWGLAFVVTVAFGGVKNSIGSGPTFLIFGVFCFVGTLFVLAFVPETKGKSLADIQRMLNGEKVLNTDGEQGNATSDSKF